MKVAVLICLLMLAVPVTRAGVETSAFEPARRIGGAKERSFFMFSTSIGNYVIRHDGLCEVNVNARRRVFHLKVGGRVERVYFYEYQGDLVLLYEGSDGTGYLARINQQSRKTRWLTPVKSYNIGPSLVEGDSAYFGAANLLAKVDLKTGGYLWKNDIDTSVEQFQLPIIKGDLVIFGEQTGNGRSIEVNRIDGTVRRINDGH